MPWAKRSDACNSTPDDDTVRSGAGNGPALINIADGTGRYVSAIGEIGNLRDHIATVDLGLIGNADCNGDVTCGAVQVWRIEGDAFVNVRVDIVGPYGP